jgi:hypothetical protein
MENGVLVISLPVEDPKFMRIPVESPDTSPDDEGE